MEDFELDKEEVTDFVDKYIKLLETEEKVIAFVTGFLVCKGYEYEIAELVGYNIAEEIWK